MPTGGEPGPTIRIFALPTSVGQSMDVKPVAAARGKTGWPTRVRRSVRQRTKRPSGAWRRRVGLIAAQGACHGKAHGYGRARVNGQWNRS